MISKWLTYFSIKKSGYFDSRYYLRTYDDIRRADVNPLLHFVFTGWKEGRNPSELFNTNHYVLNHPGINFQQINPLVHYLNSIKKRQSDSQLTISKIAKLLPKAIVFFFKLKGIVFFSGYPFPNREKDGYYQRIRSIDNLFLNHWRIYVDPFDSQNNESWYELPAPKALILRPNVPGYHRFIMFCAALCILKCRVTYFHSLLSVGKLRYNNLFWKIPFVTKILDMHGSVPEEFEYQGEADNANYFNLLEKFVLSRVNYVIVVTNAMKIHIEKKYPEIKTLKFISLPIFQQLPINDSAKPLIDEKPVIIYAGGTQKWQQIPKIIDAITETIDKYFFRFYCPDPSQVLEMLPYHIRNHPSFILGSKSVSELAFDYKLSHYGFILREDIIVNHVACPTKLIEYLAFGIVPIVDCRNIGDFEQMGMRYITLSDLLKNQLPGESKRKKYAEENYEVYKNLLEKHKIGVMDLRKAARLKNPKV